MNNKKCAVQVRRGELGLKGKESLLLYTKEINIIVHNRWLKIQS